MILFDFEQSMEKSVLTLSGPLKKEDAQDLKRLLLNWSTGNSRLIIDLNGVTEISSPCREIFAFINHRLQKAGKQLVITGKPGPEVLRQS